MEGSDIKDCWNSYKIHDISRLLDIKFNKCYSKLGVNFDFPDNPIISSLTGNDEAVSKSKDIFLKHYNVLKEAEVLEKGLLESQVKSFEELRECSKLSNFDEEDMISQLRMPKISINQEIKKDQFNVNWSNHMEFQEFSGKSKKIAHGNLNYKLDTVSLLKENDAFSATPAEVIFNNYEVGLVYEIPIIIKNEGKLLRKLRVIPPRSPSFSLGLGQFPSEKGSIAPGLHCQYYVKFCPDSLANYEDFLVFEVECGNDLMVPLKAIRPPPILKMLSSFDMGDCLLGNSKYKRFIIRNEGAPGKFCIIPESQWPAVKLKTLLSAEAVCIGDVFKIKTIYFHLSFDEMVEIDVTFCPFFATDYSENVLIVCDNCQLKKISMSGRGVMPKVEIVEVEDGWSCYGANDMKDITAEFLIRFSDVNPHSVISKKLLVRNCIGDDLPFHWDNFYSKFKPIYLQSDNGSGESKDQIAKGVSERRVVCNSKFLIEPKVGLLPSNGILDFTINFCPEEVGKYQEVIHLQIEFLELHCKNSLPLLELELIGVCLHHKISIFPQVLLLPSPIPTQNESKQLIKVINESASKVSFHWDLLKRPYALFIKPTSGEISPKSEEVFELTLFSDHPCSIDDNLQCIIDCRECLILQLIGEFMSPRLEVSQNKIYFGLVCVGEAVEKMITIINHSSSDMNWFIFSENNMDVRELSFHPNSFGLLKAFEEQKLVLRFESSTAQRVHHYLKLSTYLGTSSIHLEVEADVQMPLLCLDRSHLNFSDARIKRTEVDIVKLINKTTIAATFEWKCESQQSNYIITLDPMRGCIEPRGRLDCKITFCSLIEGTFCDIIIPCKVGYTDDIILLCVSANVTKSQESFEIQIVDVEKFNTTCNPRSDWSNLEIDYGLNNCVGSISQKYLLIKSLSDEEKLFNLSVMNFNPCVVLSSDEYTCLRNVKDTKEMSRQRKCLQKKIFGGLNTQGAVFVVHPSSGVLAPDESILIIVAALSDTFGVYTDELICQVGCCELSIPIKYGAEGCPVQFQMLSSSSPLNLRFDRCYYGQEAIKRCITVINTSSIDVVLDWNISLKCDSDGQVVDIIPDFMLIPGDIDETGKRLLKLRMLTHKGQKISRENPFKICPSSAVVCAKDKVSFEINFCPPACIMQDLFYTCTASAFLVINNICDRNVCGLLHRKHRYDLDTLDLILSAEVISPELVAQDEGLQFKCAASNLLLDGLVGLKDYHMEFNSVYLMNKGPQDVFFEILTDPPFGFSVCERDHASEGSDIRLIIRCPSSGRKSIFYGRSSIIVLKPNTQKKVKVLFLLTPNMLKSCYVGQQCENGQEIKLHFMSQMELRILSVSKQGHHNFLKEQQLSLYATVVLPKWCLSKQCVDFGSCHLDEVAKNELTISNTSSSVSYFMIEPCHPIEEFSVIPSCGTLGTRMTIVLEVCFKPRKVMSYDSSFVVHGLLEEPLGTLSVRGTGTLDEHQMKNL